MPSWLSNIFKKQDGSESVKPLAEKGYGRGGRGNIGSKIVRAEAPESGMESSGSSMFSASTTRSNNYSTGRGGAANIAPAGVVSGMRDEVASKILAARKKELLARGGEVKHSSRSGGVIVDKPSSYGLIGV